MQTKQEASLYRHITMTNDKLPIQLHYTGYSQLAAAQGTVPTPNQCRKGALVPVSPPENVSRNGYLRQRKDKESSSSG